MSGLLTTSTTYPSVDVYDTFGNITLNEITAVKNNSC